MKCVFGGRFRRLAGKGLVLLAAVVIMALGAALYFRGGIGADPLSTVCDGLFRQFGIPRGTASMAINAALMLIFIWFNRSYLHVGSVITALGVGPFIALWEAAFSRVLGGWAPALPAAILLALAGAVLVAAGRALYLPCSCGASPLDMMILTFSKWTGRSYGQSSAIVSILLFSIGLLLGGAWGVGTLIAVFLTGFIVDLFSARWGEKLRGILGL